MNFYPVNINVQGKKCVVVGGGKIAFDKIVGLLEAGAKIDVIAPRICAEIEKIADKIHIIRENYSSDKITAGVILIAATNNPALNQQIASDARAKNFLVNIVDDLASDFIVPSRIRREDFLLTISTGGQSPAFSRFVREMLESEFDAKFGAALKIIASYRPKVQPLLPTHQARIRFWREVLTPEVWRLIRAGELEVLEGKIENAVASVGAELQNGAD